MTTEQMRLYEQNYFKIEKNILHRKERNKRLKEVIHGQMLMVKYGITKEQYNTLLLTQDGKCAVCGNENIVNGKHKMLCVDHNHETGKVRGLLCDNCNRALGQVHDQPDILLKLASYLKLY